jgi:hypothetical protein
MNEPLSSSETSVLKISTRHNIPEDANFHGHRRENRKSYTHNFISVRWVKSSFSEMNLLYDVSNKIENAS